MANKYKDKNGHWTTKENDGGECNHGSGNNTSDKLEPTAYRAKRDFYKFKEKYGSTNDAIFELATQRNLRPEETEKIIDELGIKDEISDFYYKELTGKSNSDFDNEELDFEEDNSNKIAKAMAKLINKNGGHGFFGGEKAKAIDNQLTLISQLGKSTYTVNPDGSIDVAGEFNEDDFEDEGNIHYDSIEDLLNEDGWFYNFTLEEYEEALKNK